MKPNKRIATNIAYLSTLVLACSLMSSCGEETLAKVSTGGTGSYTSGSISGLGSIIVNNIRYEDSGATIVDTEDNTITNGNLGLGTVVEIEGGTVSTDAATDLSSATATRIKKRIEVQGRINSHQDSTMQINGVQVNIKPSTIVVGCTSNASGQYATVYGFSNNATSQVLATRIECQTLNFRIWLRKGIITSISNSVLSIGSINIDYSNSNSIPITPLAVGMPVTVILAPGTLSNGNYSATRVLQVKPSLGTTGQVSFGEVEGEITAINSSVSIAVDGLTVNINNLNIASKLKIGMRVRVKGSLSNGVMQATKIDIKTDDNDPNEEFKFIGLITYVNDNPSYIKVKGQVIYINSETELDDLPNNMLRVGLLVQVRATVGADGKLIASRIEGGD